VTTAIQVRFMKLTRRRTAISGQQQARHQAPCRRPPNTLPPQAAPRSALEEHGQRGDNTTSHDRLGIDFRRREPESSEKFGRQKA